MDRLILCRTCAEGDALATTLAGRLPEGMTVETADCLNLCARPVAMALRGASKDVYLFADVQPGDLADILALARLYVEAPGGRISDARAAGRLRHCLVGRVPG